MTDTPATETPKGEEAPVTEVTPEVTPAETPEVTPEVTPEETPEVTPEETPEETPEPSAPDFSKFVTEMEENSNLSDDSYAELEAMGYERSVVDAYIKGATDGVTEADADALITKYGGQESYDNLIKWAGENLTPEQAETFNKSLTSKANAEISMEWLQTKMQAAEGFDPSVTLEGDPVPNPKADVYADRKEVTKAMSDPRYGKDKAYTKQVEAKTARSALF